MFSTNYKKLKDESLMDKVKKGNVKAFDELYTRYSSRLLHYFYRMLGKDGEKAQDFLQDLFLKIVEKPHLFDAKKRFSTWVFTIAANMCKNEYRRLKVRVNGDCYIGDFNVTANDVVLPKMEHRIDNESFKRLLFAEAEKLNDIKRSTFLLRYQEHFSIKEISDIMNCSEGTVKSRLFYITQQLAEKLKAFNPKNESYG